jgi:hypothetical protein
MGDKNSSEKRLKKRSEKGSQKRLNKRLELGS